LIDNSLDDIHCSYCLERGGLKVWKCDNGTKRQAPASPIGFD
jgi:hypothetical protein